MKILSTSFLLIAASFFSFGQEFAFEYWHEGKIVLEKGDTLRGNIKYDLQNDLVQYQIPNSIETFTTRKVLMFDIFDETVKRYRQFYSLPFAGVTQYKALMFFELLEEGKLTLLCRESLEYRSSSSAFYYYGSYSRLVIIYRYFIMNEKGEINEFNGKRKDWLDIMGKQAGEVQKYAKVNRLNFEEKYDLTRIVEYYNSLF